MAAKINAIERGAAVRPLDCRDDSAIHETFGEINGSVGSTQASQVLETVCDQRPQPGRVGVLAGGFLGPERAAGERADFRDQNDRGSCPFAAIPADPVRRPEVPPAWPRHPRGPRRRRRPSPGRGDGPAASTVTYPLCPWR